MSLHESECPWAPDVLADYWIAPDDFRRTMLLKNGFDPSLRSEVDRLFPPAPEKEKKPKDWTKISVFVSIFIFIAGAVVSLLIARFV